MNTGAVHDLYSSLNILSLSKTRRKKHIACMILAMYT